MADISQYYEEHAGLVYKYLHKLSGDADIAEELTQETFYQAMRTVDRYRGECKPSVWLCQIARHCWYKHLEKNKRDKDRAQLEEGIATNEAGPEERMVSADEKMRLYAKMQGLRSEVREVMYLRILAELSFREIGEIMQQSENWARVTYFRGKKALLEESE